MSTSRWILTIALIIWWKVGLSQDVIFTETCGNPAGSVPVTVYTGWSNPVYPVFSGNVNVEKVSPSSGYEGASGGGNIYFKGLANVRFMIDWINTEDYEDVELQFGVIKLGNGSVRSHLKVETSIDGLFWKNLPFNAEESAGCWVLAETGDDLPRAKRLRIRFSTQSASPRPFRIDDISLEGEMEDCVLPVTVSSFGVEPRELFNLVKWNTLSETHIKYYTVNRSLDGRSWSLIANIPSRWEESLTNRYQIEDEEIRPGLMYYQLLVYEEDGSVHHPRMAAVMREEGEEVKYYDMMGNEVKNPGFGRVLFRKKNNHIDKIYISYEK